MENENENEKENILANKNEDCKILIENKDNENLNNNNDDEDYFLVKGKFKYNSIQEKNELSKKVSSLNALISEIKSKKKIFYEDSRLYCCSCTSICLIMLILIFFIFDTIKFNKYCNMNGNGNGQISDSKSYSNANNNELDIDTFNNEREDLEYCNAPSISFITKFAFLSVLFMILIMTFYCTGRTILVFDPNLNIFSINKKKLLCIPSINYYYISELEEAFIESDMSNLDGPKIQTFSFYSVTLKMKNKERLALGFGRDCFFLYLKKEIVQKINDYIDVLRKSKNIVL